MINLTIHQNKGKIETDDKSIFDRILSEFTVPNPNSRFSIYAEATLKAISLFGTFEVGLTFIILKKIKEIYPNEKINISNELMELAKPLNINHEIINPINGEYKYRDYQEKAIILAMKYGRGIALLPTAAGKSLVIYGILANILNDKIKNNIILVPNILLVTQMYNDLLKYGMNKNDVSMFSSKSPTLYDTKVVITNRQWLEQFTTKEINNRKKSNTKLRKERELITNSNLTDFSKHLYKKSIKPIENKRKKKYQDLLNIKKLDFEEVRKIYIKDVNKSIDNNKKRIENINNYIDKIYNFDSIIIDECHQLKPRNEVVKYIKQIKTNVRFGLTGTMPENQYDTWYVHGLIGSILHTEEVYDLQQRKFIADINIIFINFKHKKLPNFVDFKIKYTNPKLYKEQCEKAFYNEWKYLEDFFPYNYKIAKLAEKLKGNTLLLFDHTSHGQQLHKLIDKKKYFIDGSVDLDDRDDIKAEMEIMTNTVLVGNVKAVGVGMSIKNIDNILLAVSGKGVTKIIQALGRGLRLREGKTKLNLFDISHNFYYSQKHREDRKILYKKFYNKENFVKKIINI